MLHRRNRFFGKNSDAKIGCVVSAGRRLRDTPTVAGLRRRRLQPGTAQRPAIFQAGLWGFARPKPGLHGTLLREFPKSSFKQEISARPAPFRPARPSRHPEGQQTYRKEHTPPDKQREPFPMKRFRFLFRGVSRRSGLERVDVQLERAFQVTGLVLVDDVVLGQLVQPSTLPWAATLRQRSSRWCCAAPSPHCAPSCDRDGCAHVW